ncbi:hypothetical protein [Streptomyces sp. 3211]|uniref:hypothetical protein n=1 Tax=Streptomyces sp. 3211 TaxID=1964449 RepID=UPI0009A4A575|nr:hypothetical protein [Streptomyces sp. 3211]
MLTEEDARRLVLAEIAQARDCVEYELGILRVQQLAFGWLFYWGAVGDRQIGQRPRLGGNGPFLVDRENERVIRTATSAPVERQIADYERRLRREAHARNAAAKKSVTQLGTTTPTTVPIGSRPSGTS